MEIKEGDRASLIADASYSDGYFLYVRNDPTYLDRDINQKTINNLTGTYQYCRPIQHSKYDIKTLKYLGETYQMMGNLR